MALVQVDDVQPAIAASDEAAVLDHRRRATDLIPRGVLPDQLAALAEQRGDGRAYVGELDVLELFDLLVFDAVDLRLGAGGVIQDLGPGRGIDEFEPHDGLDGIAGILPQPEALEFVLDPHVDQGPD